MPTIPRTKFPQLRAARYRSRMVAAVDFTISFDSPDEEDWIVARVLEVLEQ
jgi:hypothetical protein